MQRSIATIKVNTIKNETRTKNDIKKRTKENTQLIRELNQLRMERDKMKQEIKTLKEELQDIKFKQNKRERSKQTAMKQAASMSVARDSEEHIPSLLGRPRSGLKAGTQGRASGGGGKLFKGTPFDYRKSNLEDKAKISELQAQLEDNNQVILMQKLEIRSLKEQVIHMVQDREGIMGEQEMSQYSP